MKKKLFPGLLAVLFFACAFFALPARAAVFQVDFETASQGIQLVNLDTGTVVYQKNADQRLEPASTTKIMTYIVVAENIPDLAGTPITITPEVVTDLLGTGSSLAGVREGEVLTALQLLNCMMVPSGNDAALAFAYYVGGGDPQAFVAMMNEKAAELGCTGTHFTNPHGLHDPEHYTTAEDLAVMLEYALTLPYFSEICAQTYYELPATNVSSEPRYVYTTNMLLSQNSEYYYRYCTGGKTGSHDQAGYCLASTAVKNGYSYLCVTLGAPSVDADGARVPVNGAFTDAEALYEWAFDNLEIKTVLEETRSVCDVPLELAWNQDTLLLVPEQNYAAILPVDVAATSVIVTPHLPESVEAPVTRGEVVGTATLSYAGQELAEVNLVAAVSVERSELLNSAKTVGEIVSSTWFLAVAAVIVVLLLLYIILSVIYNRKKKNLRRVKKYRRM